MGGIDRFMTVLLSTIGVICNLIGYLTLSWDFVYIGTMFISIIPFKLGLLDTILDYREEKEE